MHPATPCSDAIPSSALKNPCETPMLCHAMSLVILLLLRVLAPCSACSESQRCPPRNSLSLSPLSLSLPLSLCHWRISPFNIDVLFSNACLRACRSSRQSCLASGPSRSHSSRCSSSSPSASSCPTSPSTPTAPRPGDALPSLFLPKSASSTRFDVPSSCERGLPRCVVVDDQINAQTLRSPSVRIRNRGHGGYPSPQTPLPTPLSAPFSTERPDKVPNRGLSWHGNHATVQITSSKGRADVLKLWEAPVLVQVITCCERDWQSQEDMVTII
eukprot:852415-Rhodomonas_salina.1